MIFFIKKNSSLPKLVFEISDSIIENYSLTQEMLENCAITFSMIDSETGKYKIANVPAKLNVETPNLSFTEFKKFHLIYQFRLKDTNKIGNYFGEFKIDFLESCTAGKLTLPVDDRIIIVVHDSITKTDVI